MAFRSRYKHHLRASQWLGRKEWGKAGGGSEAGRTTSCGYWNQVPSLVDWQAEPREKPLAESCRIGRRPMKMEISVAQVGLEAMRVHLLDPCSGSHSICSLTLEIIPSALVLLHSLYESRSGKATAPLSNLFHSGYHFLGKQPTAAPWAYNRVLHMQTGNRNNRTFGYSLTRTVVEKTSLLM